MKLIKTRIAATQLGTSQAHVRRLLNEGALKGKRQPNGYWQVYDVSVARYLRDRPLVGRPLGALSEEAPSNRGGEGTERAEREREYQREYRREYRRGIRRSTPQ